jgi:uncharacterized protein YecT (DUF1311 family)
MTHRFAALALALSLAAVPAGGIAAQTAGAFMKNPAFRDPAPKECVTTFDMQHCAAHELRAADAQMTARYKAKRARVSPSARQRLRVDQRKWLAWRDRNCMAKGDRYKGGSMAGVVVTQCWVDVTKARARALAGR